MIIWWVVSSQGDPLKNGLDQQTMNPTCTYSRMDDAMHMPMQRITQFLIFQNHLEVHNQHAICNMQYALFTKPKPKEFITVSMIHTSTSDEVYDGSKLSSKISICRSRALWILSSKGCKQVAKMTILGKYIRNLSYPEKNYQSDSANPIEWGEKPLKSPLIYQHSNQNGRCFNLSLKHLQTHQSIAYNVITSKWLSSMGQNSKRIYCCEKEIRINMYNAILKGDLSSNICIYQFFFANFWYAIICCYR